MKHIQTIQPACLKNSAVHGGCGECQTSCQSACKTSCTVANQKCQQKDTSGQVYLVIEASVYRQAFFHVYARTMFGHSGQAYALKSIFS